MNQTVTKFWKRTRLRVALAIAFAASFACLVVIKTHPLVFNESFFGHAHCWKIADGFLQQYAHEHAGRYPCHTNGYGDAILLINGVWLGCFSGPGYSTEAWEKAQREGSNVPEDQCGRVYVQGLSNTDNADIVLLFDKVPTAGDHCHFFRRLSASLVREVVKIGGVTIIPESQWPAVVKEQIELLVAAGISRQQAESYYAETAGKSQ